jgi:hypothetical protein
MKKRKLQLEELRVESTNMSVGGTPEGTVHGAQQSIITCPWTFDCAYPTANPSCPPTATQGMEYTCAQGCMVPRTDALACCTQGECTIYICSAN